MTVKRIDVSRVKELSCEGGGIRGLAYVGAVTALEEMGVLSRCRVFSGASAGAITALSLAIGSDAAAVARLAEETPWRKFGSPRWQIVFREVRMWVARGWHSLGHLHDFVRGIIAGAGMSPDELTFGKLQDLTGKTLMVPVTDWGRSQWIACTPDLTPDALVWEMVAASATIPVWWPPMRTTSFPSTWLVDGGLVLNHPVAMHGEHNPGRLLGMRVDSAEEIQGWGDPRKPPRTATGSLVRAFNMARESANEAHIPSVLWPRIVRIDTGDASATDFRMSEGRRSDLVMAGYRAVADSCYVTGSPA